MIFESKQTVNGKPVWAVDTDKLTVTHITKTGEAELHHFWHDCVKVCLPCAKQAYRRKCRQINSVPSFALIVFENLVVFRRNFVIVLFQLFMLTL